MESIFGTAALVATEAGELIRVIVEVISNFRLKIGRDYSRIRTAFEQLSS